jgi:hypothetical protein
MTVEQLFEPVAARLLEEDPGLEPGRMMRAEGLKTAGKFFAFVVDGALVVKLPAERVGELVASGEGRPFESGRRVMKEWVSLRPADEVTCAARVVEAREFVAALAARKP